MNLSSLTNQKLLNHALESVLNTDQFLIFTVHLWCLIMQIIKSLQKWQVLQNTEP